MFWHFALRFRYSNYVLTFYTMSCHIALHFQDTTGESNVSGETCSVVVSTSFITSSMTWNNVECSIPLMSFTCLPFTLPMFQELTGTCKYLLGDITGPPYLQSGESLLGSCGSLVLLPLQTEESMISGIRWVAFVRIVVYFNLNW